MKRKRYTWEQLTLKVEAKIVDRTMKRVMQAALNYHKCLVCVKEWLAESFEKKRLKWVTVMLNKYSRKRTDFEYASAMKCILAMNLRDSCILFESQTHDIDETAYNIVIHHLKKIERDYIAELRWATISNRIFIFMMCRAIAMKKWRIRFTSTLFSSSSSSHGWSEGMILCWKKMMIRATIRARHATLSKSERKITIWSIISTVLHLLIWSSLKCAGCLLSNTYESILIETTSACVNWSWRNGHE